MDAIDAIDSGELRITVRRYGPTVHLTLSGELDLDAQPAIAEVRAAVLRNGVALVACDLHHVPFMDVSGLRCLIDFQEQAREQGITVLAYNWRPQPLRLLRLLHLLDSLEAVDDTGLQALRGILREHTEAQLALGTDAAGHPSALVDGDRTGYVRRRHEPGPAPSAGEWSTARLRGATGPARRVP
ncbi:STAS domain-containing protein [Streptomyces sp. ISL-66]|uniref:STAS domain-containing protein n=1 Tax=Streptomyces sp. ISL-66 TaxID=2819186 RepID=UPI001BE70BBA|nr:STAS domain-containing protein [Streptomyces sp. ISL-66]MBT2467744.1 STAS domain-containing protein [Streptomyces sp. ISL-66]